MSHELETIYKYMEKTDNDVHLAVVLASAELDMCERELLEIYDRGE